MDDELVRMMDVVSRYPGYLGGDSLGHAAREWLDDEYTPEEVEQILSMVTEDDDSEAA